jgi:hypothetical protein
MQLIEPPSTDEPAEEPDGCCNPDKELRAAHLDRGHSILVCGSARSGWAGSTGAEVGKVLRIDLCLERSRSRSSGMRLIIAGNPMLPATLT